MNFWLAKLSRVACPLCERCAFSLVRRLPVWPPNFALALCTQNPPSRRAADAPRLDDGDDGVDDDIDVHHADEGGADSTLTPKFKQYSLFSTVKK